MPQQSVPLERNIAMPLGGGTLGVLTPPTKGGRSSDKSSAQHAVMQVRIDKDKEAARLASVEDLAREWGFVRGGDPDKDEAPKPNLTGMINFVWETIEANEPLRHHIELHIQQNAMKTMSQLTDEIMNQDAQDDDDQEYLEHAAGWMERAEQHCADLRGAINEALN